MGTEPDTAVECLFLVALALGARPEDISRACAVSGTTRPRHRQTLESFASLLDLELAFHRAVSGARLPCDLPAIARLRDGTYVVLIEHGAAQVRVRHPRYPRAEQLDTVAFAERWTGQLVALRPRRTAEGHSAPVHQTLLTGSGVGVVRLAEIVLATCGLQVLGLATPLVFQTVVDKVLASHALATLDVMCAALAGVALFESSLGYLRSLSVARLAAQIEVHTGENFFARLLGLAPKQTAARQASVIFARLRDLDALRGFATGNMLLLLPDVLFISVFLGVMYHYSPVLSRVLLIAMPCLVCAAVLPGILATRPSEDRLMRGAETQALLLESLGSFSGLKAMVAEARQLARWRFALMHSTEAAFSVACRTALAAQAVLLVQKLCLVVVLWLGAQEVMQGRLTVGGLIAFNLLAGRALQPLLRMGQCWLEYRQVRLAWRRVREFLQTPVEFDWAARAPRLPVPRGTIELRRVSFRYEDQGPEILLDLDFRIESGERIALAGPEGSGKTTLLALIQATYAPSRGRITIDGVPLAGRDPRWMRQHVGPVSSALPLVAGSVHDNIALRHPEATRAEVIRAARAAGVDSVILRLGHGYDTLLGGPPPLSGSQVARLRLARALLGEPPILLCDDQHEIALAMLDASSARQTCVVVSDHPAVRSRVDRVLVLDASGRVQGQGPAAPKRHAAGDSP